MFGRHRRKYRLLFGLSDVLLTFLAFELAYRARLALPFERVFYIVTATKVLLLGTVAVLWPLAGMWLKIYDRLETERLGVIVKDTFKQCCIGGIGVIVLEYSRRLDLSRPFVVLFLVFSWILLCLFRIAAPRVIGWYRRGFGSPYYVLVAGTGERARKMGTALESSSDYGIRLLGFMGADGVPPSGEIRLRGIYPVHALEDLPKLLDSQIIDEIIFAVDSGRLSELEEVFLLCDEDGVRTRVAVDFFPHVHSDIYMDRLQNLPLLTFSTAPHDEVRLMLKRMLDVTLAAVSLAALAPVLVLIGVVIRLTSSGPAIFTQERCGLNGRRFRLHKFRSMVQDAEQRKALLEHLNEKTTAFKIARDPRVTPVGRVLRKFSIDEWPQLWNVLKGDMSLVGPRPSVPAEVERYQRWQRRRLRMRPGLTCLWALEGRDRLDFDTWMKKDLEYIDNWSLLLDCTIILRTIPHVLSGKGAN